VFPTQRFKALPAAWVCSQLLTLAEALDCCYEPAIARTLTRTLPNESQSLGKVWFYRTAIDTAKLTRHETIVHDDLIAPASSYQLTDPVLSLDLEKSREANADPCQKTN
jgi:hypothetical protein